MPGSMTWPPTPRYRLIAKDEDLVEALAQLEGPVAVDTEFHSERHYAPRLKLIQLRDRSGEALLVDPKAVRDLKAIGRALSGRTLLVYALSHDLPLLAEHADLVPGAVVDPQILAAFCGHGYPRALGDLVQELLGEEMPPGVSLSNWTQRPLSEAQLEYAAADVRWLHALTERLSAEAERLGQLAWAEETTAEQVQAAMAPPDTELWWRHLPGAAVLDGPGRAALRALYAWREERAQELDQPRWQVASDSALLDLARRRPVDAEEIARNRKLSRRLARDFAPAVLGILRAAEATPEAECPPPVAIRGAAAMQDALLAAWSYGVELDRGVAAALLLPRTTRRDLVLRWLDARWPSPLSGWRDRAFGEEIAAVIEGRQTLRAPKKPSR